MSGEEKRAMEKPYWEGKEYSYFSHKNCEYFPCHKGADPENFNCLFCYCPLYALGDKCGGNFRFTESGIKDCTECKLPHRRENFGSDTGKCIFLCLNWPVLFGGQYLLSVGKDTEDHSLVWRKTLSLGIWLLRISCSGNMA